MKEAVRSVEVPQALFTPETSLYPEVATQLGEIFSASPKIVREYTPVIRDITGKLAATAADPHTREAAIFAGNALGWHYLGQPGRTLPDGMIITTSLGSETVEYDRRRWFGEDCIIGNWSRLNYLGLDTIEAALKADLESRLPEATAIVEAMIKTTPAYEFLQSFDEQGPREPDEVPLNRDQLRQRIAEKTKTVRREYKMDSRERIEKGSAEEYFLRKSVGRLDLETTYSETLPHTNHSALANARYYFATDYIKEKFPYEDVETRQQKILEVFSNYSESDEGEDIAIDFPRPIIERLHGENIDPLTFVASEEFLKYALEAIREAELGHDYQALLANAVNRAAKTTALFTLDGYKQLLSDVRDMDDIHLRAWLQAPQGEHIATEILDDHPDIKHAHSSETYFLTEAETRERKSKVVGRVDNNEFDDPEARVITVQNRDPDLPRNYSGADLYLSLSAEEFRHRDPFIPGYKLVAGMNTFNTIVHFTEGGGQIHNNSYAFIRDPENDPYSLADVLIPADAVESLAQQYIDIGLEALAEQMRNADYLTVDMWLNMFRSSVIAFFPTGPEPIPVNASTVADFRKWVHDNKLREQCTVADNFLRLSLDSMFGKGSAGSISGHPLPSRGGGEIVALGHQQTTFVYDNKLYIIDGTLPPINASNSVRFGTTSTTPPEVPKMPEDVDVDALMGEGTNPDSLLGRSEQALQIRTNLEKYARMNLRVKGGDREELYAALNKRPANDPLRGVLSTVLQITWGDTFTQADLRRLRQKVQRYGTDQQRADGRLHDEVEPYSEDTLRMFGSIVKRVQKLVVDGPVERMASTESSHEPTDN